MIQNQVNTKSSDALWNLIGIIFSRGTIMILGIIVARSNLIIDYAAYNIAILYSTMFTSIVGGSILTSAINVFARSNVERKHVLSYIRKIICLLLALAAILYAASFTINPQSPESIKTKTLFTLAIPYIALTIFSNALQGIFNAHKLFYDIATYQILFSATTFSGILIFGTKIDSVIITLSVSTFIGIFLMLLKLKYWNNVKTSIYHKKRPETDQENTFSSKLLHSFFPIFVSALAVAPAHWLSTSILYFSGRNQAEIALFTTALQWFIAASLIPASLANVSLPNQVSEWMHVSNKLIAKRLKEEIFKNIKIMLAFSLILVCLTPIIASIYKFPQENAWLVLSMAFFASIFLAIQLPAANQMLAAKKFAAGFTMNLIWFMLYISATFLLKDYASMGAITALTLAYIIHTTYTVTYVFKFILK